MGKLFFFKWNTILMKLPFLVQLWRHGTLYSFKRRIFISGSCLGLCDSSPAADAESQWFTLSLSWPLLLDTELSRTGGSGVGGVLPSTSCARRDWLGCDVTRHGWSRTNIAAGTKDHCHCCFNGSINTWHLYISAQTGEIHQKLFQLHFW